MYKNCSCGINIPSKYKLLLGPIRAECVECGNILYILQGNITVYDPQDKPHDTGEEMV